MTPLSPTQCRAGRALVKMTQSDLAAAAQVAKKTIADFEAEVRTPYRRTIAALQQALEAAGVEFIPENGGGVGVRLRDRAAPAPADHD
jgi:DNA-binding XRE family transcriptional regulator